VAKDRLLGRHFATIAESLACGKVTFVPDQLEVAREYIIPEQTGLTYNNATDLRQCLASPPAIRPELPIEIDWYANASATLQSYQEAVANRIGLRIGALHQT
jgi:hypothetical protein